MMPARGARGSEHPSRAIGEAVPRRGGRPAGSWRLLGRAAPVPELCRPRWILPPPPAGRPARRVAGPRTAATPLGAGRPGRRPRTVVTVALGALGVSEWTTGRTDGSERRA